MSKTLYITNGPNSGQYLQLEDAVASAAISDEWAVDSFGDPQFDRYNFPPAFDRGGEYPDSLQDFLDDVNGVDEIEAEHHARLSGETLDETKRDEAKQKARQKRRQTQREGRQEGRQDRRQERQDGRQERQDTRQDARQPSVQPVTRRSRGDE